MRLAPAPKFNPTDHELKIDLLHNALQRVLLDAKQSIDQSMYGAEGRLMQGGFLRKKETYETTLHALQVSQTCLAVLLRIQQRNHSLQTCCGQETKSTKVR